MLFFADSGEAVLPQSMLIGSATTIVVVTLLAINALNHPYQAGIGGIRPVAMERTLSLVDQARAVVHDRAPLPCDAAGIQVKS
jgi:hypothetical protein